LDCDKKYRDGDEELAPPPSKKNGDCITASAHRGKMKRPPSEYFLNRF
jgi:hypothetical protein